MFKVIHMDNKYNPKLVALSQTLRKNMTPEEKRLWYDFLSNYPIRFKKQKVIGRYIVDFYCARAGLVIELDGSQHSYPEALEYDAKRTEYLEKYGLTVIRIANEDVNKNLTEVCEYIDQAVMQRINTI